MRGIPDTASNELSMYMSDHWRLPSNTIRRLSLRKDGFASLRAGYTGGEIVTRTLVCAGGQLSLNVSTSAVGSVRVEVQDPEGRPLPGLGLDDCAEIFADEIDRSVRWSDDSALAAVVGRPVRLRFALCDADLYTFHFTGD